MAALASVEVEPDARDEDVHSAIERLLGELGPRVHAGRSRNDQVQTAMRLWAKQACGDLIEGVRGLAGALLDRADAEGDAVLPGYTHGQRAQPVWLGQHLAAHVWALTRDLRRLSAGARGGRRVPAGRGRAGRLEPAARSRLGGRGAGLRPLVCELAGRGLRPRLRDAGSATPRRCAWCTCRGSAEELVLWTSAEYGFAELDDSAATGSRR